MDNHGFAVSRHGLDRHGLSARNVYWHLPPEQLYEHALRRGEAMIAAGGPLICRTGEHTGRSPKDKFIVEHASIAKDIWWGAHNRPIAAEKFDGLFAKIKAYVANHDAFVFDGYAGADARYRMRVRVISQYAWHSIFARNMFVRETDPVKLESFVPEFTVIDFPAVQAEPAVDGTNSGTFILLDLERHMVLIGGSQYAGEIKKGIFSVMNYYLPKQGVLSMHCSANYGANKEETALFFGLSGTGKTTLSADPERTLIGDDEHGWSADGIFNIEGGCYAKVIKLSPEGEPDIYATTKNFGTILENVVADPETRVLDLDDARYTENTRASYPIGQIRNADLGGTAGHPTHVLFLTADAFGVLPPIARLDEAQAMYHFLSGYTAKVAGTERGVTEPSATFSTCFGAPFLPLQPSVYARMLGDKLKKHGAKVWLINTGWTGGPYGTGSRMKLAHTRRMVTAALSGELDRAEMVADAVFGFAVPKHVAGVPDTVLQPRGTWEDGKAYDAQAKKLAEMFRKNFEQFAATAGEEIAKAGPKA